MADKSDEELIADVNEGFRIDDVTSKLLAFGRIIRPSLKAMATDDDSPYMTDPGSVNYEQVASLLVDYPQLTEAVTHITAQIRIAELTLRETQGDGITDLAEIALVAQIIATYLGVKEDKS